MKKVLITNNTQDNMVLAWCHQGREMPSIMIKFCALNQEVLFSNEEYFQSFYNAHKGLFDREVLTIGNCRESEAQKKNEALEKEANKEIMNEAQDELEKQLAEVDNGNIEVTIRNQVNNEIVAQASTNEAKAKGKGRK